MNGFFIASIVEGHGEVAALPILLRRIHGEMTSAPVELLVNSPIRIKAGSFFNDSEYRHRYLQMAAAKARHSGRKPLILVLLDCEDGCPATLGPELSNSLASQSGSIPVMVVLAYREYETWLLAAASSLSGVRGFPDGIEAPFDPEKRRDAKGWLTQQLGRRYNEPSDQPAFTSAFDMDVAGVVASFSRLRRKLKAFFDE
jgi:hypothetical protein